MNTLHEYFAAAIPGTEKALCSELRELGFRSVRLNRGGIPFRGTREDGWRACLETRIAQRIQRLLARFPVRSASDLYDGTRSIDWQLFVDNQRTLAVSAVCRGSVITHSSFAALKVKDAICDKVRATSGGRPDINRDAPDVNVFLYLANDKAAVYVDLAGAPLHRRGYRTDTGVAPLRETLAAAVLRLSGWNRRDPLYDPMCGSGTIAIEAAMWASELAPGLMRSQFGFERWASFAPDDDKTLRDMVGELRAQASGTSPPITASDADADVLAKAQGNARAAGVRLSFRQRDVTEVQGKPGIIVTNPPYGVRLDRDPDLCRRFAAAVSRLHGWRICILAGSPEYPRAIAARPTARHPVRNGDLECEVLVYDMP